MTESYAFGSIDELGEGYGFRSVRRALGVTAFGVNAVVMPPGFDGFLHYHDTQDELYLVHRGRARFEVGGEVRELGPGGLCHVEATTPLFERVFGLESLSELPRLDELGDEADLRARLEAVAERRPA